MAFKEVQNLDSEITTALGGRNKKTGKLNPTQVEGYFLGSKDTVSKKSKTGFAKLHVLQTSEGNLGVWGKTDLDRKMASVPQGAMVRITQSGTVPTPNGDMYKFRVEVDTDNVLDAASFSPVSSSSSSSEVDDEGEEETEEEVTHFTSKPVSADPSRQSRVQALLSKKTAV